MIELNSEELVELQAMSTLLTDAEAPGIPPEPAPVDEILPVAVPIKPQFPAERIKTMTLDPNGQLTEEVPADETAEDEAPEAPDLPDEDEAVEEDPEDEEDADDTADDVVDEEPAE